MTYDKTEVSRVPWAGSPVFPMQPFKHTPSSTRVFKGVRRLKSAPQWPALARSYSRDTEYGKDLACLMPLLQVVLPGPFQSTNLPILAFDDCVAPAL